MNDVFFILVNPPYSAGLTLTSLGYFIISQLQFKQRTNLSK